MESADPRSLMYGMQDNEAISDRCFQVEMGENMMQESKLEDMKNETFVINLGEPSPGTPSLQDAFKKYKKKKQVRFYC